MRFEPTDTKTWQRSEHASRRNRLEAKAQEEVAPSKRKGTHADACDSLCEDNFTDCGIGYNETRVGWLDGRCRVPQGVSGEESPGFEELDGR